MNDRTDQAADPELTRLLDACDAANRRLAIAYAELGRNAQEDADADAEADRAALLGYIAAHYVRRDAPRPPDGLAPRASAPGSYKAARGILPWRPGDELPEERIRRLRDGADSSPSWRGWRATVGNGRVRHNRTDAVGRIVMDTDEGVDVAWDGADGVVFYDRYEAVDKLEPEGHDDKENADVP